MVKRGMPPLASLRGEGTASHERRGNQIAHTEYRISIRTTTRTRAAVRIAEQIDRHPPGASPPPDALERITPPTKQLQPAPSLTEPSSEVLLPTKPGHGIRRSTVATRPGPRPTPTPPNEAIKSTGRGASAVAGGQRVFTTKTSVSDTVGPAEDVG